MLDRREFLRRAAIIAGGAIAADQLELVERLTARKIFASPFPRGMGEVQLLDMNGRVWRRLPYNGEKIIKVLEGHERTRWLRVSLNQPAEGIVINQLGLSLWSTGGTTFTLPYDQSASDLVGVKTLFRV